MRGEHLNVYANKLRQLAEMARFTGCSFDTEMKLAFVTGFHNDISTELQQAPSIETLTMGDFLTRARALTRDMTEDTVAATLLPRSEVKDPLEANPRKGITCYMCRGQSHMVRDCATRRLGGTNAQASHQETRCFKCNKIVHFASECQGNGSEEKMPSSISSPSK